MKKDNLSNVGHDTRSIQRIIFEKANFGAPPIEFSINGVEGWHPVQWTQHPHLAAVRFADGSVVYIDAPPAYAPLDPIAKGGDNEPWDYKPVGELVRETDDRTESNSRWTYSDVLGTNLKDSNLMQDAADALADLAMVDVVLSDSLAMTPMRGAVSGVIGEPIVGDVDLKEESVAEMEPEPTFDAELRNVHRDGTGRLHGFIHNDKTGRFVDGAWITTSKIEAELGDDRFRTTTGTVYGVVSWVKDLSLKDRVDVGMNIQINESNVES